MIRVIARRKYLSDCKDACPGLLSLSFSDIDGSLVLVSCTTISVYVNLSKNVLYKRAHQRSATSRRGGFTSFAGAKVRFFCELTKLFETFFKKKMHFCLLYIIYYIRAREKSKENGRHSTWSDCRFMLSQKDIYPSYFTKTWLCRGLSRSAYLKPFGLALLSLNQDLDFVEVFHVRNTSNELGFALT